MLGALAEAIPDRERIVTIEDSAELILDQEHVVRMETRPENIEGRGLITARDLVVNALRMRPDRIIVGEVRSGEALDMLQAMNTGHDGGMTTVHANSPRDALARLETMVLMAGLDLPSRAIREQIVSALHLIVHVRRFEDGVRRLESIAEIVGMEGTTPQLQDIFRFERRGQRGRQIAGEFVATGIVPRVVEELHERGIEIPRTIFQKSKPAKQSQGGEIPQSDGRNFKPDMRCRTVKCCGHGDSQFAGFIFDRGSRDFIELNHVEILILAGLLLGLGVIAAYWRNAQSANWPASAWSMRPRSPSIAAGSRFPRPVPSSCGTASCPGCSVFWRPGSCTSPSAGPCPS